MQKFILGDLVNHDSIGKCIIIGSYKDQFGSGTTKEYTIAEVDDNMNVINERSWICEKNLSLISHDENDKNLNAIRKYNIKNGGAAPIAYLSDYARKLGYNTIHTYDSAIHNRKTGDIIL